MKIEFLKDFATMKKGEVWDCTNSILAAQLIHKKVAKAVKKRGRKPKEDE